MLDWVWSAAQRPWLLLLLFATMGSAVLWARRTFLRYRRSSIAKRALGAETAALALLRQRGYVILETQVRQLWPVLHGGRQVDVTLRADALVRKGKRRYVAEVKSSSLVADLKHGPTRRQLLEYAIAYDTDGVLLIDMHAQHVEEVTFPGLGRTAEAQVGPVLTACCVAFVLGLWFGMSEMVWRS